MLYDGGGCEWERMCREDANDKMQFSGDGKSVAGKMVCEFGNGA